LILGAIGLFFVTALAGRVWCGFACPQTVWTDLFLWAERLIEGDRAARMRLDAAPLSAAKAAKKVLKHGIWLTISVATGGAWILYFEDAFTVTPRIFAGEESMTVYFFIGLFTATTYLLAGWAREQVCIYMCPWPRFQSAMFDEHSLIVTYETWRGEPRGKAKPGTSSRAAAIASTAASAIRCVRPASTSARASNCLHRLRAVRRRLPGRDGPLRAAARPDHL